MQEDEMKTALLSTLAALTLTATFATSSQAGLIGLLTSKHRDWASSNRSEA